jgi:glycosyltransferase involved in cell wall biosynthesis
MRLAFVAHPNSIHTRRWVAWFARAGHDVTIVDPVGVQIEMGLPPHIEVVHPEPVTGFGPVGWLRRRARLRHVLAALRPDIVHAHYLARFGWAAADAGVHPLVVSPWGSDLLQVPTRRLRTRLWNRRALRRADLVTVSSDGMREAAIAAGAGADRIRHVHHGVDTQRFHPGPAAPPLRRRAGIGDGELVVVSPRTIAPLYRHDVVVDAVAEVGRRLPQMPWLVMSARGADPASLEAVRARAAAAGIGERLRIIDDVAPDDLPELYRLADVVVSVPETDSFAVSLLEAMACGRPVVASDLPAVAPVLGGLDPVARQLIVPIGDAFATATALEHALVLDEPERHRLGEALREHVVRTAEYDTNMATMERLYRELAASR